uniref:Immunoglobulin domain-containing protein n=1 Tax=Chelydra serpentina TaxID=8475 RepID=A0A8C3XRU3_CHESE
VHCPRWASAVRKAMKAILSFAGCWALTGPVEVSGPLGGSVSVQCQYNERYQNYKKYWCIGEKRLFCSIVVQTDSSEAEAAGDRVSIQDNHKQRTFTVTMESLTQSDQDVYWCGIKRSIFYGDNMFAVNVSVFPGKSLKSSVSSMDAAKLGVHNSSVSLPTSAATIDPRRGSQVLLTLPSPSILLEFPQKPLPLSSPRTPSDSRLVPRVPLFGIEQSYAISLGAISR